MKWLLPIIFLSFSVLHSKPLDLEIHAEKALLMNGETGAILFEKEGHTPTFPASTTKISTALYALEVKKRELEKLVVVKKGALSSITPQAKRDSNYRSPPHWLETDGMHIGLKSGEELTFNQLLHGLLIGSANDAANVIAMSISGSVPKFMEEVNRYLIAIGCQETSFNNPHGLHHPAHVTTAYDLALMTKKGLENPLFRDIVGKASYTCPQTNLEYERTFRQTNLLMRSGAYNYPKAIGVKTGSTQAAGKNLVSAAVDGNRLLIAVVLGCQSRAEVYQDTLKLFESAFSEQKMRRILLPVGDASLTQKVKGARSSLKTTLPEGLFYDFYLSEDEKVKAVIHWNLPSLPIRKGVEVGSVSVVSQEGEVLKSSPIIAAADLKRSIWPYLLISLIVGAPVIWIFSTFRK
ncbi:MAG: D-alanyl-D-alanine carboxypeptidase DacF [Chlamydiales bacterium]|nr:D-alanyl-D-alanine carboxypeptidase DacF [Chlamydiales bacterium]MCH9619761.1 D-alanyl-D-alanine carboxypeptidase DacF [Chlamydiales bacterium]MCH9623367.1 D-alanyl-D-alanine carboxypeptidase DacF [Chlamydiales bacterium]